MDIQNQLFEMALNIGEPIYIEKIEFLKEEGELHIFLNFRRGGKFVCPNCGKEGCGAHDTENKTWRHLNFFEYKCYLHFRTPYVKCDECGVHLFIPFWGRAQSGFTLLFEAMILALAKEMPVSEIAAKTDEHDTRLWRIINAHVKKSYSEKDFSEVQKVGVDETSSKKGHKYVSVFVDMERKEILFATEGKDAATVGRFAEELPKHCAKPEQIKEISMDMSPAFIKGVNNNFENASITFDKFHVVKHLNEAIDEIRRNEQKTNPCLKGRLNNNSCKWE